MTASADRRRSTLHAVVEGLGYTEDLVQTDFPVWSGVSTERVDLAAFGRLQPQDMTTATLVAQSVEDEGALEWTIDLARALACPAALLALPDQLELWSVMSGDAGTRVLGTADYGNPEDSVREYQRWLEPAALLFAKTSPQQMSLFPIDVALLAQARDRSAAALSARVNQAIATSIRHSNSKRDPEAFDKAASLVVTAITALVARDKFGKTGEPDPAVVLRTAAEAFPGYFRVAEHLEPAEHATLFELITLLGSDVNYASLDPTVVSQVYEEALVSEASQRELGIYYTPPDLARRIASQIPIEELPPADRIVLDPACGSGSLLLAAHDRLDNAVPGDPDPIARHDYVRARLLGFDSDPFAVEIARLALLLHALPAGNQWQVEQKAINELPQHLPVRPRVIFSNPPWRTLRWAGEGRAELADRFLLTMLELLAPSGYLAAILPASWLTSASSHAARGVLADKGNVFEVWRLPRDTFGSSSLTPCVVFAQAAQRSNPFVFRRMMPRGDWKDRFYRGGNADENYVSVKHRPPQTWVRGPLDGAEDQLEHLRRLSDLAEVQLGPPPKQPVTERGGVGPDRWLRRARDLPAFGEASESSLVPVRFPEEFSKRSQQRRLIDRHKLLVSSMSTGDRAWRMKVSFDFRGIIPRQSLFMVAPRDESNETLMALAAILGSSVASAWVGARAPRLHIRGEFLKSLPVPPFDRWRGALADVTSALLTQHSHGGLRAETLLELEHIVLDAYDLPATTRRALERHFSGERAPDGFVRYPPIDVPHEEPGGRARHYGAIFDVDEDRVKLWLPGLTESDGTWFPLPPRLPGWLCVPGRTFEARVGSGGIEEAIYTFQSRSFVGLEDLAAGLRRSA